MISGRDEVTVTTSAWCLAIVLAMAPSAVAAQEWRREPVSGSTYHVNGVESDPAVYPMTAGGGRDPVNVATLVLYDAVSGSFCGQAFITRPPDFRLIFENEAALEFLRFYVITHNSADATLLVNLPDGGWRCNDDSFDTSMPSIDLTDASPGRYDIWVGTYDASSNNPATFFVTERRENTPVSFNSVDLARRGQELPTVAPGEFHPSVPGINTATLRSNFASLTLASGFRPSSRTASGRTGGVVNVSLARIDSADDQNCTGYVAVNPDHILTLTSHFDYLRIDALAAGDVDLTMVVEDPYDNFWCSDDVGDSTNPRVEGAFVPGVYRIWIGSSSQGRSHDYELTVTGTSPGGSHP